MSETAKSSARLIYARDRKQQQRTRNRRINIRRAIYHVDKSTYRPVRGWRNLVKRRTRGVYREYCGRHRRFVFGVVKYSDKSFMTLKLQSYGFAFSSDNLQSYNLPRAPRVIRSLSIMRFLGRLSLIRGINYYQYRNIPPIRLP